VGSIRGLRLGRPVEKNMNRIASDYGVPREFQTEFTPPRGKSRDQVWILLSGAVEPMKGGWDHDPNIA
jgi:hypothetical protein